MGKFWAQFAWIKGWNTPVDQPKRSIAWAETVAVRLGLIMCNKLLTVAGRKLSCLSDNTTTNGAAKNLRSRDFWVNHEWKLIQTMLVKLDCTVSLHYVKSKDNEADELSRGKDPSKKKSYCLNIEVPSDLRSLLYQVLP